jgi:hypothetical protein
MFKFRGIKLHKIVLFSVGIISVPILINYLLMTWGAPFVFGTPDSWLGFLANYSGGIIGGIVAYIAANTQVKQQIENERNKMIESNRSYVCAQQFSGTFKLHNVETSYNSRIILTKDYDDFISSNSDDDLKHLITTFLKITHYGTPDIILNADIKIYLDDPITQNSKKVIESHLGVIEKNEEVFFPLYQDGVKEILMNKVEITYFTISGEHIYYLYSPKTQREGYWLLKGNEKEKIFEFELKNSDWIYPNRNKIDINT